MYKAGVVFVIATCIAAPAALARDRPMAKPAVAPAAPAAIQDDTTVAEGKARSGFGQVMRMLTDLLQEAARKQASATGNDAPLPATADNSAVSISVTPVAGRSSFYAPKPASGKFIQRTPGQPELAAQGGGD